jgi:enamine deaminase RidA (YjgF/YER057c/UK114 family)
VEAALADGWHLMQEDSVMARITRGEVHYINPAALHANPAFTQMVTVSGPVKTVTIGAQCAVDGDGKIVGKGDLAAQTEQVLKNIEACLEAAGAGPEHLIHWSIYVAAGQDMRPAFEVGMRWWGGRPNPPMNNVMYVAGFYPPDFLISIEAIAVVPLEDT